MFAITFAALLLPACHGSRDHSPPIATDALDLAALADPPRAYGPWVRWWWPGGDVEEAELRREVRALADAGFAGAEIQAFDAGLDPNAPADELARRRSFDTPDFYDHVAAAMDEALGAGLAIDLNLGSGWPMGGGFVAPEDSLQTLLWAERAVTGPGPATVNVAVPDVPVFYVVAAILELLGVDRWARFLPEFAERVEVLAARVTGGARSGNPLELTDTVEVDPDSVVFLTDQVAADGTLTWDAPPGDWRVVAFFRAPDGEWPVLPAEPDPTFVADHLDAARVLASLAHLAGPRTGLDAYHGAPLRALFSDSFELKTERLFADDFLDFFSARRGYDLRPWLPAALVPGADNSIFDTAALKRAPAFRFGADDARIQDDYTRTVSDLLIERFLEGGGAWASARDLALRAQVYGMDVDLLRAAGATAIPEAEQLYAGGSDLFVKIVSSAALLHDRPVVTAESLVWIDRAMMTTPLKMKAAVEKLLAAGVNQAIFHGFPYRRTEGFAEAGWHPFASSFTGNNVSSMVGEGSPFWDVRRDVNRAIARAQYAMRQGAPAADLLVYYPWYGFPTTLAAEGAHAEFLFNGRLGELEPPARLADLLEFGRAIGLSGTDARVTWLEGLWPTLQALEAQGWTWAWVNDERLAAARAEGDEIAIGDHRFRAVVVSDAPAMEPAAAESLAAVAAEGGAVILAGEAPTRQRSFFDRSAGDVRVAASMDTIRQAARGRATGSFTTLPGTLASLGTRPAVGMTSNGDAARLASRVFPRGGRLVFFRNTARATVTATLDVESGCASPHRFDPWTGEIRALAVTTVDLPPWGSTFVLCGLARGGMPEASSSFRRDVSIDAWTLTVSGNDVEGGAFAANLTDLPDWRDVEALRYASSPGTYRANVNVGALTSGEHAWLVVPWVHGAAEVRVNGTPAGRLLVPPFELDVTNLLAAGVNGVEIVVTPALRNRFVGRALTGDPLYANFGGDPDAILPNGIEGPARIEIRGP
ncbi:MAG: hypothetical protein KC466_11490 [Myxococcales bacterium]|nr:hypothetical protein [Myxococcales bacterium]